MIEHVHGEAVAERVGGDLDAEPHAGARGCIDGAVYPVSHRAVGDGPHRQGAALAALGIGLKLLPDARKQPAHLVDVGRIGERHDAVRARAFPGAPTAGAPLLGRADHHVRDGIVQAEVATPQRQHLVEPAAGVPERVDQGMLGPVRDVVQQAAYLRRQQVAGQLGVGRGHGPQRQRATVVGLRGRQRDRAVQDR